MNIENQDKTKIILNTFVDLMNYLYLALKTKIIGFNDSAIAKIKKYKKNDKLDYFSLKKYIMFK